jgi:hypothetical protein
MKTNPGMNLKAMTLLHQLQGLRGYTRETYDL